MRVKRYIEVKHCNDPDHPRQFSVENSEADHVNYEQMKWDDYYIRFGGYFGNIGPHVFAAAPDLLEALEESFLALLSAREFIMKKYGSTNPAREEAIDLARAAIAKAKGETK